MESREPLYRQVADWTVDTDGCRVREVVQKLLHHIEELPSPFYPKRHDSDA
jgi:shikimate kinase